MPPQERQAQLNRASQQAQKIGQSIDTLARARDRGLELSPQTSVQEAKNFLTTTSDPARNEVNAIENDIRRLTQEEPDTASIRALAERERSLISQRREELDRQEEEEISGIRRDFENLKFETEEEQEREFAGRSVGLITQAGGALGLTQSQEGVLNNMRQGHRREIQALEAKKQTAIREARNAFAERDFNLARESLRIARETEQAIFNREQAFVERELQINREIRSQQEFEQDQTDRTADLLTQSLTPALDDIDDPEERERIIMQSAMKHGIDPTILAGKINVALRERAIEDLDIRSKEIGIETDLAKLKELRNNALTGNIPTDALPTFEEFVDGVQNRMGQTLMPNVRAELREEYDTQITQIQTRPLDFSNTQKQDIQAARLTNSLPIVQNYFVNTPNRFREEFIRNQQINPVSEVSLDDLNQAYQEWYQANGGLGWDLVPSSPTGE